MLILKIKQVLCKYSRLVGYVLVIVLGRLKVQSTLVQEVWSICCPLSHSWRDPVYRGCDVSLVLAFYLCLKLSDLLLFISAYLDNLYSVPWLVYRTSK